jgi:allophanate hydrolase subunit 2
MDQESMRVAQSIVGAKNPALEVLGGAVSLEALENCFVAIVGDETHGSRCCSVGRGEVLSLTGRAFTVAWRLGSGPSLKLDGIPEVERLRAVEGPQAHLLPPIAGSFKVSNLISRAGIRLERRLAPHQVELPSEPACVGAIQITPDGGAIILGPDGPTIGGYPKAAAVCGADLDKLAYLKPGATFELEIIDLAEARTLLREHRLRIERRLAEVRLALTHLAS